MSVRADAVRNRRAKAAKVPSLWKASVRRLPGLEVVTVTAHSRTRASWHGLNYRARADRTEADAATKTAGSRPAARPNNFILSKIPLLIWLRHRELLGLPDARNPRTISVLSRRGPGAPCAR